MTVSVTVKAMVTATATATGRMAAPNAHCFWPSPSPRPSWSWRWGLASGAAAWALLADAGHMLADAGALVLALVAQHFADQPRTEKSTFGLRRAEVLAAFVNGITLAFVSLLIVKEAVERWMAPVEIHGRPMLATAVAGLLVNLLVAFLLMARPKQSQRARCAGARAHRRARLGGCNPGCARGIVLGPDPCRSAAFGFDRRAGRVQRLARATRNDGHLAGERSTAPRRDGDSERDCRLPRCRVRSRPARLANLGALRRAHRSRDLGAWATMVPTCVVKSPSV